ncbi:MAG: dynamin family protein [Xenococcus sp. MO_188.B8]|nr:dynamin family protein [Xenococcus sp. MO_188.B8]
MQVQNSNLYEIYNQRRDELLELAVKQAQIVNELKIDDIQTKGTKQGEIINGLVSRLKTDKLRVLVVGRFSAGKSTFINALLGQKLLPSTPAPTTGVLCKINYSSEQDKKVTLYPKKGMGLNGEDEPFDIEVNQLESYIKIDHFNEDDEVTSRYKLMELEWPLELCANGVELIDSVGLDDPDSRDEITLAYAKSVDAVLYLMKSQDTASKKDLDTIKLLRTLGYESLFFIITYYDHIKESALWGEMSEAEFQKGVERNLTEFTELGYRGIKYVDSRSGLMGRMKRDYQMIADSGIEDIEKSLESFLVEQKGKAKLVTTLRSLRSVNRAARQVIPSRIAMLQTSNEELEKRYEEAKVPLANLEMKRQLMISKFDSAIYDIAREAYDLADAYFQDLPNKIPAWAKEYKIESGLGIPPRQKTLEPVVREVLNHLKNKIESNTAEWATDELSPIVETRIQEVQNNLESEAREFLKSVDRLRVNISIGNQLSDEDLAKQKRPTVWGRLIAGGYTLMTGDFVTGGAGMVMGLKAMANTIVIQIIAGIILGIFGLINPIAIISAAIASIIAGNFLNILSLKGAIKKNIGNKLSEELTSRRRDLAKEVEKKVKDNLMELRNALDQGLAGEISSVKDEVEKILEERRKGKLDTKKEIQKLRRFEDSNLDIDNQLETLMYEAGLS